MEDPDSGSSQEKPAHEIEADIDEWCGMAE
jgi:hypothetical protein